MSVNHVSRVAKLERESALALFEGIGSVRALTAYLLIKNHEDEQYLGLSVDPSRYDDPLIFSDDLLVTEVLKKNPRLKTSYDLKQVAIGKFYESERLCAETNSRISDFCKEPHVVAPDQIPFILRIQALISAILGPCPSRKDLDFAERNMRFGPGSTTSLSGIVTPGSKYKNRSLDCTKELVSFRTHAFPAIWRENNNSIRVVDGSKLTTVPKNAKTDRSICIEPDLNIFVQLGIGALLRKKLQNFGLDISSADKNRELASKAYSHGLCTVDLAAASDTIAISVVEMLLPPSWVELLRYARCAKTTVAKELITLEKWSSMGNGYTFELESLIFHACSLAVTPEDEWENVVTFGDDMILPRKYLSSLTSALTFLGFKVNKEKTFGTGNFFESCGTDWFRGVNVRPFYLRSTHHDFETICYIYANAATNWSCRRNGGDSRDSRVLPFWLRCFRAVAAKDAHLIPQGYGDVGFYTAFDRATPIRANRDIGYSGWKFSYRRIASKKAFISQMGCYVSFLNGNRSDFTFGEEDLRSRYEPATTKKGYVLTWPHLGPWL